jgi:hypothetical protein
MSAYPEHEKLHRVKEELGTEFIGAFLEWLGHDGIQLARYWDHETNCESVSDDEDPDGPSPFRHRSENWRWYKHTKKNCGYENDGMLICIHEPIMKLLARYADVDLEKLETEKRQMLDDARREMTERGMT